MIAAGERNRRKLMVSFFEFFHPAFRRARELVERGAIGDVFLYKAIMAWYTPSMDAWRFDPKVSGGGVIMDGHVHHVAYLLHLLGNPPIESVYAEYGTLNSTARVEDTAVTLIRTPRVLAEIDGSNRLLEPNAQSGGSFKESIDIYGSRGTIRLQPTQRPSLLVYAPELQIGTGLNDGWIAPRLQQVPHTHRPVFESLQSRRKPVGGRTPALHRRVRQRYATGVGRTVRPPSPGSTDDGLRVRPSRSSPAARIARPSRSMRLGVLQALPSKLDDLSAERLTKVREMGFTGTGLPTTYAPTEISTHRAREIGAMFAGAGLDLVE